jgi:hypothetical protein
MVNMVNKNCDGKQLVIKPILTYAIPKKKKATTWREWGGIQTKDAAIEEIQRISNELEKLVRKAEFPIRILPITPITSESEVPKVEDIESADVILVYAAGGDAGILLALQGLKKQNLIFLRHKSGAFYLWNEIIQARFLRSYSDEFVQPNIGPDDVVVDDYDEILWRLRAFYGLKNTIGSKVVVIGKASGWPGEYAHMVQNIPYLAQQRWDLDIKIISYLEFNKLLKEAIKNEDFLKRASYNADRYLSQSGVTLHTDKKFVVNAFVVYKVFKDLLNNYQSQAITVDQCMSAIIPIAGTTACLPLNLLNDEGYMAFCESDFAAIPSGILLHYISSKPVFLNDPTYPHNGIVTLAHCTAPRRMNGQDYEETDIVTHFESDYGAAPSVKMKKGQEITIMDPDFKEKQWLGFKGIIIEPTSYSICRTQIDVAIEGDWRTLLHKMRGFHWVAVYGDYLKEVEYAVKKMRLIWETI